MADDQRTAHTRLAHAGYLRAVAAALETAGVPVADWRADPGPPRDGWIPFDLTRQMSRHGRPVWDHDQAGAAWCEQDGWCLLTVDDPAGRDVRTRQALPVPVLAAPGAVARAVTHLAGLPEPPAGGGEPLPDAHPGPGRGSPGYRAGTADPAFEAALLRYARSRTKSVDGWRAAAEGRG